MNLTYHIGSRISKSDMELYQQKIIEESLNGRFIASQRNIDISDPIRVGTLVHGVRRYSVEKLESILDNGVLSPEFTGEIEDGETFYHLSLFESHVNSIKEWQAYAEMKTRFTGFLPNSIQYPSNRSRIALIINKEWDSKNMVHVGVDSELKLYDKKWAINEKCIAMPFDPLIANHVAVYGGIPSTYINGIIMPVEIDKEKIVGLTIRKGFYIPLFNILGEQVY